MSEIELWRELKGNEIHVIRAEKDGLYFDVFLNVNNDMPYVDGKCFEWKELWTEIFKQ